MFFIFITLTICWGISSFRDAIRRSWGIRCLSAFSPVACGVSVMRVEEFPFSAIGLVPTPLCCVEKNMWLFWIFLLSFAINLY